MMVFSLKAQASQVIEYADQQHQQATISSHEQNRLAIEGRRITHVVPSRKGVMTVVKDEAHGAMYFALSHDTPNPGTVTLFVSDNKGITYKLILVPRPVAGEEIILRPPIAKTVPSSSRNNRALAYQRRIKDLMLVMTDDTSEDRVDSTPVNKAIPLWKESHFVLMTRYITHELVGEKYQLTNISPSDMTLVEQELYRPGVEAVAVEHHTLGSGDSTPVFIVRERHDDE